jgi:serine/threonine-protein kinase
MAPPSEIPAALVFKAGADIARQYTIIDCLGDGGFGVVYLAEDKFSKKRVALKFLKKEPEGEDLDSLLREIAIGGFIKHPNVCHLHETGTFNGATFLSMEYVEGGDMEKLLRKIKRLARETAIEYSIELCAGLGAIHEKRVVHCDLKPANVMLDRGGHAKITDFGMAVPANVRVARGGTPLYMAPEQWKYLPPLPSADIYSLGLMMFELFTGKRCIELPLVWKIADILAAHAVARTRRPSTEATGLDPAIDGIVSACLEEDSPKRPSADQLRVLLENL